MNRTVTLLIFLSFFLIACTQEETKPQEKAPELLDVSIQTPENIQVNQEITIEASVVQGKEKVSDADEVKFEVWQVGKDKHEMLEANNEKNGVYSIKMTFKEDGKHYIVAHVTANRMHNMPKKEVIVESDDITSPDEHQDEGAEHENDEHHEEGSENTHDDHHNSEVNFDFQVHNTIKSNEETELNVQIKQDTHLITGASVRFEIWRENDSKHDFISAQEGSKGTYFLPFTFTSSGVFNIKIHVEKGNIHDHTNKTVEVH